MEMLHGTIDVASRFGLHVFLGIPYAASPPETSNCDGIQVILVKGLVPETPQRYFRFEGQGARGLQRDVPWAYLCRSRGAKDSIGDEQYLRIVEAESLEGSTTQIPGPADPGFLKPSFEDGIFMGGGEPEPS